jgi:phage gp29-like protein
MWHSDGREIFAAEVRHRDQRRFGFNATDNGYELRLLTKSNWLQGEVIPPRKIVYHSPTATDLNPYGLGLDSKIFWPVFFKRQDIQFWLIFADKFGSPTPLGKYSPGESEANKAILMEALNSITQGLAAAVPEGMTIEFIEAIRGGSVQTYEGLCRYMDEQISECILGQTGTTNQSSGGGSRARDEVARTGTMALIQADADLLARTLDRTLIRWIVELNRPILGEQARPPHLSWVFEEAKGKELAERDNIVVSWGYEPTEEYVQENYGTGFVKAVTHFDSAQGATEVAAPAEDVQQTALNGAQISSLVQLVQEVVAGTLPLESALQLLTIAFPNISQDSARTILAPTVGFKSAGAFPNLGNLPPGDPPPVPPGRGEVNLSDPLPLAEFAEDDALPPGELPEAYRRQASTRLGPVIDGWVDQVKSMLEAAEDFDQFSDGLIALYPDLAKDEFAEVMRDSLLAAHLGGIAEVDVEASDDPD